VGKKKKSGSNTHNAEHSQEDITRQISWLLTIGGGLWVVVILVAVFHHGITQKVKFATDSSLSLFVLLAVISQVIIYRTMAVQNERLIKASETSSRVAKEAFHAGEAPYFGLPDITANDWQSGYYPKLRVNFLNGGKTPAWRIHTWVKFSLGQTPERGHLYELRLENQQMVNTFIPAQTAHDFNYIQTGFQLTEAILTAMANDEIHLFVVVEIHYRDFRRVWHSQVFRAISEGHRFRDYDASERACAVCKKKGYDDL